MLVDTYNENNDPPQKKFTDFTWICAVITHICTYDTAFWIKRALNTI